MYKLLTVLLSFYPTFFIYNSVINVFGKKLDALAPAGINFFIAHLIVFAVIFFVVYRVFSKYISFGYMGGFKRGFLGTALAATLTLAIVLIAFYIFLPGAVIYAAPALVQKYVLAQPFLLIWLVLPFAFLFFD